MRLAALAAVLALASCATQKAATTGAAPSGLLAFTEADLTTAIADAQAAAATNLVAQMIVTCFTLVKSQLASLQPPAPAGGTVGLATAFTVADLALSNIDAGTGATAQAQYAIACGPLVTWTANRGVALGSQVAMLGALIAR